MYLIALCDDETEELNKAEQMLKNYEKNHPEIKFETERFKNADELLCQVIEKNYMPDIILMDVYMPEKIGTEAARELRDMGSKSRIIFLTSSKEHALDAFRVDASQYLVKPVSEKDVFPILDKLLENMEKERKKYILLRIEGRTQRVALNNIVYCEAQGKSQRLHFSDGTYCSFNKTMTAIYDMLCGYPEFVRVGAAYIVNMEHIVSLNRQELEMDNGKMIYLPRGSYQPLREKYFGYYFEDGK